MPLLYFSVMISLAHSMNIFIHSLSEAEERLEERCSELETKLEELQVEERKRQKQQKRTWSVPSLNDAADYNAGLGYSEFKGISSCTSRQDFIEKRFFDNHNIFNLKDQVRNLKAQLEREKLRNGELEMEVSGLAGENKALDEQLRSLETEKKRIGTLESELEAMEISLGKLCKSCGSKIMKMSIGSEMNEGELYEHDNVENIGRGEVVRLKNGGSAYGSRESLNMIGLETDDVVMTPVVEVCRDILAAAVREQQERSESEEKEPSPKPEISILGELEEQYHSLVMKYENLIEAKSKKAEKDISAQVNLPEESGKRPGHLALKTDQDAPPVVMRRKPKVDLRSPLDPTDDHFNNGPPQYKRLFKEMFQTLRRSVVFEDDMNVVAGEDNIKAPSNGC